MVQINTKKVLLNILIILIPSITITSSVYLVLKGKEDVKGVSVVQERSTPYITNMISNVAYVGKEYIFVPRIVGGNTENLSVSIQEGPSWMAVDENGFVVGIPTIQDIGTYRVILTVSDGTLSSDLVDYVIVE
ncbi:hypothetical protein A3K02_01930 [candidate division WS6 bacterium RIFOXYD1_FULL_33_8]|uniref:Serine protease n=2 Tax=Candidatus Dojkabacteria TaxID=74243 RepID=A0A0G0CVY1_9BACT|nr:MAG: Serine protease [candidate division WS6 bacterium GW2011_GWB1_33_6]OGC42900.1 MAG: hypothetical protein A3K02_01930 [candidate division WS6 bacterium RIFOXYD1_FULL_33_8]